ncbi:hypothetical protein [Ancylobacter polymorphus]|uniref:Uncharacterized protein n=1 Tax=Ancylobacter polymorphus TaxID=223390 RepID=A0ABU0BFE7_9HYPH|nr:hypothetical protein [Ancylobacter polymorphus]MDQ0303757.1 hypothetical protein [Ancylobacter polymorphus]
MSAMTVSYLVFPTAAAALARSEQAWLDSGYQARGTFRLWDVVAHPVDGWAALRLPPAPQEAQIDMPPADYERLLTAQEHAAKVETLPGEGWPAAEI